MTERLDYGRRIARIESAKAEQRKRATLKQNTDVQNFAPREEQGKTRDIVASQIGIGSGEQLRKAQYIADHEDMVSPEDFANWDDGKLSTGFFLWKIQNKTKEAIMNKVELMGRLTRDPMIRYSNNANHTCVARFTLAVDRRRKRDGDPDADFISCVALGKLGEHAEKYYYQGIKIAVTGRIQTGSYVKNGQTIYTTDVIVEEEEFAESKAVSDQRRQSANKQSAEQKNEEPAPDADGFMNIPDGIDEELPFN